jgi:RecB family exonuclease
MTSATPLELNPAQRRTLAALGATTAERPTFADDVGPRLRAELESGLADALADLAPDEYLVITKHLLGQVHGCEVRLLVEEAAGDEFTVTVPIARGAIAHKAIELGIHWRGEPLPLDLVDEALARLATTDHWLTDFLQTCSEADRAELRATAADRVAKFFESFPPLDARWRPVTESSQTVELADGRIRLRGKVDLTLGTARGNQAGKVIIDLKTGSPNPVHRDDLRFYALLDAIRLGVPPRLVASFYLDLAEARTEPVTDDLLEAAVARTVDGVRRLTALRAGSVEPVHRPSPGCRWCLHLGDCPMGREWLVDDLGA